MPSVPIYPMIDADGNAITPLVYENSIFHNDGSAVQEVTDQAIISDKFNDQISYTKGQYCIYNNVLYKFTANKSAGVWDSSKVSATNIGSEFTTLNSTLTDTNNTITNLNRLAWPAISSNSSIKDTILSAPLGISVYNAQRATDNPTGTDISICFISKLNTSSNYTNVWIFSGTHIYRAGTGASMPSSLSFTQVV